MKFTTRSDAHMTGFRDGYTGNWTRVVTNHHSSYECCFISGLMERRLRGVCHD